MRQAIIGLINKVQSQKKTLKDIKFVSFYKENLIITLNDLPWANNKFFKDDLQVMNDNCSGQLKMATSLKIIMPDINFEQQDDQYHIFFIQAFKQLIQFFTTILVNIKSVQFSFIGAFYLPIQYIPNINSILCKYISHLCEQKTTVVELGFYFDCQILQLSDIQQILQNLSQFKMLQTANFEILESGNKERMAPIFDLGVDLPCTLQILHFKDKIQCQQSFSILCGYLPNLKNLRELSIILDSNATEKELIPDWYIPEFLFKVNQMPSLQRLKFNIKNIGLEKQTEVLPVKIFEKYLLGQQQNCQIQPQLCNLNCFEVALYEDSKVMQQVCNAFFMKYIKFNFHQLKHISFRYKSYETAENIEENIQDFLNSKLRSVTLQYQDITQKGFENLCTRLSQIEQLHTLTLDLPNLKLNKNNAILIMKIPRVLKLKLTSSDTCLKKFNNNFNEFINIIDKSMPFMTNFTFFSNSGIYNCQHYRATFYRCKLVYLLHWLKLQPYYKNFRKEVWGELFLQLFS